MAADRNPIIWEPSEDDLTRSSLAKFRNHVNKKYHLNLTNYADIHEWSVAPSTASDFWMELFEVLDMQASKAPSRTFEYDDHKREMIPTPVFFPDARMNFAGSILTNRDPSDVALYDVQEGSLELTVVTWAALYDQVQGLASAMRAHGVRKGDRVAAVISTCTPAIAMCLATLSIGAIWSSISPDFGSEAILQRILQIDPKLVFASSSVQYNGKRRDLAETIRSWAQQVSSGPSLARIILVTKVQILESQFSKVVDLPTFVKNSEPLPLQFEQVPFNHPGLIFYSSGTASISPTGAPKCILHSAGGVMLQIKKDYIMQIGVVEGDILFQYTTTAWIMWAFLLTALSTGAKVVVLDGSPLYPDITYIPRLLAKLRVTLFGTSAKYLTDLMDYGVRPRDQFDLKALRRVTSTGSVLPSDVAKWFYNAGFPRRVQLISGSGGTDCACSFVTGNPLTCVRADEVSGKSLGMAVDVFSSISDADRRITSGEPGEQVCTQPFPSQPLTFWGKDGLSKYKAAYFSMFPDAWKIFDARDGVLNPSGIRFGSAEIYNVIRLFPEVEDSVCVGQRRPTDRDESVVLFLKLKPGSPVTDKLRKRIERKISKSLSKRHVPKYIFYVHDIPYSNVGKNMRP
ncbi:hypothetical protein FGADI_8326 [Fusarium gaditjirri]|uniref:AMP-dependent synthetase/ligase domain-containing protein n=1 Tax=Fusarium gaditjirri TaxID=282569 RepID=A0A8H4WTK0_9HYPO|nr:hypothetical protein FGADI_8326 [Fusarium gaditjirri]